MKAALPEKSFQGKSRGNIFRTEECVDLNAFRIDGVCDRISVYDFDVLEYQCPEWTEMYLLEADVCVELVVEPVRHFSDNESLNPRQLDDQRRGKKEGDCRNQYHP